MQYTFEKTNDVMSKHLHQVYTHQLPKLLRFWIFMLRGTYNGFTNFNIKRLMCWFGKHTPNKVLYKEWENGEETGMYYVQCNNCGNPSKKFELCNLNKK